MNGKGEKKASWYGGTTLFHDQSFTRFGKVKLKVTLWELRNKTVSHTNIFLFQGTLKYVKFFLITTNAAQV